MENPVILGLVVVAVWSVLLLLLEVSPLHHMSRVVVMVVPGVALAAALIATRPSHRQSTPPAASKITFERVPLPVASNRQTGEEIQPKEEVPEAAAPPRGATHTADAPMAKPAAAEAGREPQAVAEKPTPPIAATPTPAETPEPIRAAQPPTPAGEAGRASTSLAAETQARQRLELELRREQAAHALTRAAFESKAAALKKALAATGHGTKPAADTQVAAAEQATAPSRPQTAETGDRRDAVNVPAPGPLAGLSRRADQIAAAAPGEPEKAADERTAEPVKGAAKEQDDAEAAPRGKAQEPAKPSQQAPTANVSEPPPEPEGTSATEQRTGAQVGLGELRRRMDSGATFPAAVVRKLPVSELIAGRKATYYAVTLINGATQKRFRFQPERYVLADKDADLAGAFQLFVGAIVSPLPAGSATLYLQAHGGNRPLTGPRNVSAARPGLARLSYLPRQGTADTFAARPAEQALRGVFQHADLPVLRAANVREIVARAGGANGVPIEILAGRLLDPADEAAGTFELILGVQWPG